MRYLTKRFLWALPLALFLGCEPPSSDAICEDACTAWDTCYQSPSDTNAGRFCDGYDYDTCYAECKADGDWSTGYVDCVESQSTCCDITDECG